MIKLRVQGLPDEVASFADALARTGVVLERSRPYANRGDSGYVRVYMDVDAGTTRSKGEFLTRRTVGFERRTDQDKG